MKDYGWWNWNSIRPLDFQAASFNRIVDKKKKINEEQSL